MRTRSIAFTLALLVAVPGVAACGSSSKSSGSQTNPATTANQPSTSAKSGKEAAVCAQVTNDLRPLTSGATNPQQILAQIRMIVPKLRADAAENGITPETRSAVNDLANALQSVENGARGANASRTIAEAANRVVTACR